MTPEERAWLLISRAISGDISAEEIEEMELIFLAQPELRADYENIKKLKLNTSGFQIEERRAMDRGLEKFDHSLTAESEFAERRLFNRYHIEPLKGGNYKSWMVAASVVTALVMSAWAIYLFKINKVVQQQVLISQYGKRIHTTLPDGSIVWLNSGSSIKYLENLNHDGNREVTLNGEAYFDVKHDIKHPFIVHAGKLNVVVLGTAFNVKAYPNEAFIETTLIRGKVEILNEAKPGTNIVLYPNEKVTVNTDEYAVKKVTLVRKKTITDADVAGTDYAALKSTAPATGMDETDWLNDRLTFKRENFTQLAAQLERWYDVKIIFDNDKYLSKQFTGTFKNQDINEVMHALQLTQSFHYAITNNQIHIW